MGFCGSVFGIIKLYNLIYIPHGVSYCFHTFVYCYCYHFGMLCSADFTTNNNSLTYNVNIDVIRMHRNTTQWTLSGHNSKFHPQNWTEATTKTQQQRNLLYFVSLLNSKTIKVSWPVVRAVYQRCTGEMSAQVDIKRAQETGDVCL